MTTKTNKPAKGSGGSPAEVRNNGQPQPGGNGKPRKAAAAKKAKAAADDRPVVYPEVRAYVAKGDGSEPGTVPALTVEKLAEIFGIETETETVKFGPNFLFIDEDGKKVRCRNNTRNRPFQRSWALTLAYEHLTRNWRLNGETMIVGKYGQVLSAQHRGLGVYMAEQIRKKDPKKWTKWWDGPVTMDTVIVFGIDETQDVTRTLDNVRPRSLADVLYCDPAMFGKDDPEKRRILTKAVQVALTCLWDRTGMRNTYFSVKRTHSASVDFIERHRRLVTLASELGKMYEHNHEENVKRIGLGSAIALCYMMACSASDGKKYRSASPRHEGDLDWSRWDIALEFWRNLTSGAPETLITRTQLRCLEDSDSAKSGRLLEKYGVLIKSWGCWVSNKNITEHRIALDYVEQTDSEGKPLPPALNDFPKVEGIDLGEQEEYDPDEDTSGDDPSPEEIAAQKRAIKDGNIAADREKEEKRKQQREELLARRKAKRQAEEDAGDENDEPSLGGDDEDEDEPSLHGGHDEDGEGGVDEDGEGSATVDDEDEKKPAKAKRPVSRKS